MTLLRQVSDRTDSKGRHYVNYFLAWRYEGKTYYLRISNTFVSEAKYLFAVAVDVPKGDMLAKYVD